MTCKQLRFFLVWNGVFGTKRRRTLPLEVCGVSFLSSYARRGGRMDEGFLPDRAKIPSPFSRAGIRNRFLGVYDQISR